MQSQNSETKGSRFPCSSHPFKPKSTSWNLPPSILQWTLQPRKGSHIRVHPENSMSVHCINLGESDRSPALNGWVLSLGLLRKCCLPISAFHIAGVLNVTVDALSRKLKWSLDWRSFAWMCLLTPPPLVDLFATLENQLFLEYVSLILDLDAVGKDTLLVDWNQWESMYLFPPASMIL